MKGACVEVGDADGAKTYDIAASRAARRVEVATVRETVEVSKTPRTGNVVRADRFMAPRIVGIIEHPALEKEPTARRRGIGENQSSLLYRGAGVLAVRRPERRAPARASYLPAQPFPP